MSTREPWSLWLAPRIYKWIFTGILATCRVKFIGRERVEELEGRGLTWIFTAWHENTAASVALERNGRVAMMASDS